MRWQPRGVWKNFDFRQLWLGQTISKFGDGMTGIALPLVAVLILQATPQQMGILTALNGTAVLVFGLLAGVWVDRLRRRPLMIATDLGRALLLVSIPLAALAGRLSLGQLYGVAALVGILNVFFEAADVSLLPGLLTASELVEGNSKLGMSDALAEIAGPALAGWFIQILGAPLAIVGDCFSFLGSAFFLARMRKKEPEPAPVQNRRSAWRETLAGVLFVLKSPQLGALALGAGLFNFAGMFIGTLYALYLVRELGVAPGVLGLLTASGGISALLGAWVAERVIKKVGLGLAAGGGLFLYGCIVLPLPLAHGPLVLVVALQFASQLLGDMTVTVHLIAERSLRQTLIPPHLLGRANASIQVLTRGVASLGALVAGVMAGYVGVRLTLLVGVVGVILAGGWLLVSPVRKVKASS